MSLADLNRELEVHMMRVSDRLGPRYRLTLVCRYDGADLADADIVKSDDDFDAAIGAIQRLRDRDPVSDKESA